MELKKVSIIWIALVMLLQMSMFSACSTYTGNMGGNTMGNNTGNHVVYENHNTKTSTPDAPITGITYYVDSENGDDNNDGKSETGAFKTISKVNSIVLRPGDGVLFKAGGFFEGNLIPKGGGTPEKPVIIDQYGEGNKPSIIGKGGAAVEIKIRGIEIRNLDITNPDGDVGIRAMIRDKGAYKHIHIKKCNIHDVRGTANYSYESGGIVFMAWGSEPSWYEDVVIEDNTIKNVCRSGIITTGLWFNRPGVDWGKNLYISDDNGWYPYKDVVVRGNQLDYTGGDGIVIIGAVSPLIEFNRVFHAQSQGRSGAFNAGIWPMNCNDAVVQYNEVAYTSLANGGGDGEGFDIDSANKNTIFQYNYSHDNDGGFLLICNANTKAPKLDADGNIMKDAQGNPIMEEKRADHSGAIIRNNLSVNDGVVSGRSIFTISGPVYGARIYNNTIYTSKGNNNSLVGAFDFLFSGYSKDFVFSNNIFYASGVTLQYDLSKQIGYKFENNVYFGVPVAPGDTSAKTFDPLFMHAGASGEGLDVGHKYRLKSGSPALTAGVEIAGNGGKDYFGADTSGKKYLGAICEAAER